MKKPTFKNHHPVGKSRSFDHMYVDIKFEKCVIGQIAFWQKAFSDPGEFQASLKVKTEPTKENLCAWRWLRLKKSFPGSDSVQVDAFKEWIIENWTTILEKFDLYFLEEELIALENFSPIVGCKPGR
ncbi:MAG: hypothetical protein WC567_03910 [Kiritimatiellia bacterium]